MLHDPQNRTQNHVGPADEKLLGPACHCSLHFLAVFSINSHSAGWASSLQVSGPWVMGIWSASGLVYAVQRYSYLSYSSVIICCIMVSTGGKVMYLTYLFFGNYSGREGE